MHIFLVMALRGYWTGHCRLGGVRKSADSDRWSVQKHNGSVLKHTFKFPMYCK